MPKHSGASDEQEDRIFGEGPRAMFWSSAACGFNTKKSSLSVSLPDLIARFITIIRLNDQF